MSNILPPGEVFIPLSFEVVTGPDSSGSYRYKIGDMLSQHRYHNAASAKFDANRPQLVTQEGQLVPESHYSPYVN